MGRGNVTAFMLLDLSAAFDTIDHKGAELAQLVRWMILNQEVTSSNFVTNLLETILLKLLESELYLRLSEIMTTFCPSIMRMSC